MGSVWGVGDLRLGIVGYRVWVFALAFWIILFLHDHCPYRHVATEGDSIIFLLSIMWRNNHFWQSEQAQDTDFVSARHRFRRCWHGSVGTAECCGWVVGIEVRDRLSAAGAFRTVGLGHENDSSPTIFEIRCSFSGGVFSVLHGVSATCVLES